MAKTLYKCVEGKMVCGVCKGIAEYLNVDVSIVRIVTALLAFTVAGFFAYFIAAIILPKH
ncbi:PspC domain-containing protein [Christensenellaceae bacterium OttesenSCG-928-M15]|nr:PspC domain-containing protein [Christensenellaceae bacterium OttesenSCG-928-M15]